MNVKTQSGDVFFLSPNVILIYGSQGIELKLSQRNLDALQELKISKDVLKDTDNKDVRFEARFNAETNTFQLDPAKGERVEVLDWMLFPAKG